MPELKVFALKKLDMIVDEFWPEISEAIEKMYESAIPCFMILQIFFFVLIINTLCYSEILHEDKSFPQHDLAALVASKVYYHLGSFEDSLTYALGAGELFDVNARNEYVDTTIGISNVPY